MKIEFRIFGPLCPKWTFSHNNMYFLRQIYIWPGLVAYKFCVFYWQRHSWLLNLMLSVCDVWISVGRMMMIRLELQSYGFSQLLHRYAPIPLHCTQPAQVHCIMLYLALLCALHYALCTKIDNTTCSTYSTAAELHWTMHCAPIGLHYSPLDLICTTALNYMLCTVRDYTEMYINSQNVLHGEQSCSEPL